MPGFTHVVVLWDVVAPDRDVGMPVTLWVRSTQGNSPTTTPPIQPRTQAAVQTSGAADRCQDLLEANQNRELFQPKGCFVDAQGFMNGKHSYMLTLKRQASESFISNITQRVL